MSPSQNSPAYQAYFVDEGGFWTKIGAVWPAKSGKALNVRLDLLPPNGRFVLMEPKAVPGTSSGSGKTDTEAA